MSGGNNTDEKLTIEIDGKPCACERGELLYDVAKRNGIFIPALCRKDEVPEHRSSCRLCIVEVTEGDRTRIVTSCVYPVTRPCEVRTGTERVKRDRAMVLALLQRRAPESAEIAQMADALGEPGLAAKLPAQVDGERCVACGLCVQICHQNGAGAIAMLGNGVDKHPGAPYGIAPKPCIGDLSCAKICPTGAIPYEEDEYHRGIWGRNFTLAYCEQCGKPLGKTAAELAHRAHERGEEPVFLCEDCAS